MEQQSLLTTILERLGHIDARLEHVQKDVARINGRINALEKWQVEEIESNAFMRGRDEERKNTILAKSHVAAIATIAAAASAAVELVARFV
ncbi:MAG: hypothetical protein KatS3mg015_2862 [Fimbriimonadales bacterium]|nr:MAG: hypothetical protein KatS3mg015_2862 [Fimbriimonadales bacterium]